MTVSMFKSLCICLLALFNPLIAAGKGIRATQVPFPALVVVNTTTDIASQYLSSWDIQKKESRRLEDGSIHLRILLYQEEELAQLDNLRSSGALGYEILPEVGEHRKLKNLHGFTGTLSCYRTVDETFASMDALVSQYPGFVTVSPIGESWLKKDGQGGHDIKVMVLTAPTGLSQKADMVVIGGHHSRELPPPETIMRWAEHLLESYGMDADITWILHRTRIHLIPLANPDGREIVQNNLSWRYRKNAHPSGCSAAQSDGVDLNRNYPMWWGSDSGSSGSPCSDSFRGGGALSEPESYAIFQYASGLFSSDMKKGTVSEAETKANEACPEDASGILIDVHSYGDFVYFPWGYDNIQSPNHESLLTMAAKLASPGDYALWGPGQDGFLYFVSGDVTDATYGIDCIPSFGYELGSAWYAECLELESTIVPIMKKSLLYAAKAASAPYKIPLGPDITSIQVDRSNPAATVLTVQASDEALIVSHAKFDSAKSQPIASIKVWVDVHPDDAAANTGLDMNPEDGGFDSVEEVATLTLDTISSQVLYVQATDSQGYKGPVSAIYAETTGSTDDDDGTGSGSGSGPSTPTGACFFNLLDTLYGWLEDYDYSSNYLWR